MPDTNSVLPEMQRLLLAWFSTNGRDLPWRHTRDPYRILVAEIMLQQTQVERVLPKYAAFLAAFPTLEALAAAPVAEVIRLWAGLGYNRRAVNLQRAARAVLEQHSGVFPHELEALRALPGIGPYTAGALACFAFEQDVAFMDTNIRRAVRRLFVGPDHDTAGMHDRALLELAQAAVPAGRGWAWNQAIMELGATICSASNPACWRCPLRTHCRAYGERQAADEQLFASVGAPAPPPQRRIAERREAPFAGSNRYYRGRAVAALRALPPGGTLTLEALGPQVRPAYASDDAAWLRTLVEALSRDGLARMDDEGRVGLP